jgi:hypothetical protein
MVYAAAYLVVETGTGLTGYPQIQLPYVMADPDQPCGIIVSQQLASTMNIVAAVAPTVGVNLASPSWVEEHIGGTPTPYPTRQAQPNANTTRTPSAPTNAHGCIRHAQTRAPSHCSTCTDAAERRPDRT